LSELFNEAKARTPSVIFLDDLQILGDKSSISKDTSIGIVNTLVQEMDNLSLSDKIMVESYIWFNIR
jgi:SpoVK/Ycf46/Vps4 family AAA+-type ATPase